MRFQNIHTAEYADALVQKRLEVILDLAFIGSVPTQRNRILQDVFAALRLHDVHMTALRQKRGKPVQKMRAVADKTLIILCDPGARAAAVDQIDVCPFLQRVVLRCGMHIKRRSRHRRGERKRYTKEPGRRVGLDSRFRRRRGCSGGSRRRLIDGDHDRLLDGNGRFFGRFRFLRAGVVDPLIQRRKLQLVGVG